MRSRRAFTPKTRRSGFFHLRAGSAHFVRNDTGAYAGYTVSTYYDPLISKLSVWGHSRQDAIARLGRALDEYVVTGITTNIAYLRSVLRHPEFTAGNYDTGLLDR